MEELLLTFGSGAIWLKWLPGFGLASHLPPMTFFVSVIFSGAGALILGKFTAGIGSLTLPINYVGLLVGAVLANWIFSGVSVPLAGDLQAPVVFALTGMTAAGLCLMALLHRLQ
jgi:hypothetical protein